MVTAAKYAAELAVAFHTPGAAAQVWLQSSCASVTGAAAPSAPPASHCGVTVTVAPPEARALADANSPPRPELSVAVTMYVVVEVGQTRCAAVVPSRPPLHAYV